MKRLLVLALILGFAGTARAAEGDMGWGALLGFSFGSPSASYTAGSTLNKPTGKMGFMVGGAFDYGIINENLSLNPELYFIQKPTNLPTTSGDIKYTFNYIELPVFVKYRFMKGNEWQPYAKAGPALGFLMTASAETPAGVTLTEDVKTKTSGTDLGFILGGGVEWKYSDAMTFLGDLRYSVGLSDTYKPSGVDKWTNNAFQIVLGANFPL